MSQPAIRVQNLSKRYRIGLKEESHDTFAGMLSDYVRRPAHNLRRLRRLTHFDGPSSTVNGQSSDDTIWALKDVSFEVQPGEVVGVIGRNGAGKSTLLKILSRITHPTSGRVELNGRVSSLLEVGTGFHPELTGRENIYLNGTILGMRKAEIDRKFDEIVDFSGVEKFIDTPAKRYSSGMRVRLAFSVAAHLEPEILLVDEVLAVGDAEFQRKCLGKMSSIASAGRTILFVSHNMGAISELCEQGILLNRGRIIFAGQVGHAIEQYMNTTNNLPENSRCANSSASLSIQGISIDNALDGELSPGDPLVISTKIKVHHPVPYVRMNLILYDGRMTKTVHLQISNKELGFDYLIPGNYKLVIRLPALWLASGIYSVVLKFRDMLNPESEKKIESSPLPLLVSGKYSKFGPTLSPPGQWLLVPDEGLESIQRI